MKKIILLALLLTVSLVTYAGQIYINEKAPGVHQVVNPKTGEKEWRTQNGGFLGKVEGSKSISDLDEDDIAYESDKVMPGRLVINPKKNGINKKWDPNRNCYVWHSSTGGYYGRVPSELQQMEWEKQQAKDWKDKLPTAPEANISFANRNSAKQGNASASGKVSADVEQQVQEMLNDAHYNVEMAREALKEIRAAKGQASAGGLDLSEIDGDLNLAEKSLEEYIRRKGGK